MMVGREVMGCREGAFGEGVGVEGERAEVERLNVGILKGMDGKETIFSRESKREQEWRGCRQVVVGKRRRGRSEAKGDT